MRVILDDIEARVLGALIEKELTTPEYYPLTLNSLTNACNQKSNRDPVVSHDEATVSLSLDSLMRKELVRRVSTAGGRVAKYQHRFDEVFDLDLKPKSLVCELLLRGPQTVGELRTRAGRMAEIPSLEVAEKLIGELMSLDPPLVARLPRQTGQKEQRYAHLLSPLPERMEEGPAAEEVDSPLARIASLEEEVARLREEINLLGKAFEEFRALF